MLSTTGTVTTTTTPTVTTTLSETWPPTVGTTHVTTAFVTTTTTATGTTTVLCPLTNEMPKQTPRFSDEQLTAISGESTPKEIRPGVVGWTPLVTPESIPVMLVHVKPLGATSAPLIQSVTVTDAVAKTVTINVYPTEDTSGTPVYSKTVPIPDSEETTVFFRPDDKLPVEGEVLEIVLGEPKNPDATNYDTTIVVVGCFEPLAATTAATTTSSATSPPASTAASTTVPPTTATAAMTTTTTLATVTTSTTTAGTTTTVICTLEELMGKDGSEPLIPLDQVSVTKDSSAVELQEYGGASKPWVVTQPTDDSQEKPAITFHISGPGINSARHVTSVSLNRDSNVKTIKVIFTSPDGEKTTFDGVPVDSEGQVNLSPPQELATELLEVVLLDPVDPDFGQYIVSPNVQGCFRAGTTTIVAPTTASSLTITPSTTVSMLSTTGTVITTTTPTVTTTLSETWPPTVGTTHVTTAVLTTSATETGIKEFLCPLSNKLPSEPAEFRNNVFTVVRGDGLPQEILPGQISWRPSVNSFSPILQIDLLAAIGSLPLLQSVSVMDRVAQFITVVVFETADTSAMPIFSETLPLHDSENVIVFLRPNDKVPVGAAIVEIILGEPKDKLAANYDTIVNLVGCFDRAIASSTIGTTTVVPGTTFGSSAPPALSSSIQPTPTSPTSVLATTVPSTLPQYCSEPFEYTECLCHKTCNDMAQSSTTVCATLGDSACQLGCQCPEGMVMNNGTCIKGADCPCYYSGNFYQFGETVASATEKCVALVCTAQGMTRSFDPVCASTETCTNGRVFQQCPCEKTCQQPNHICEMALCTAGCACAAGMLWNGSACVEQAECYCYANDVMYVNNDRWIANECTLCSCISGTQTCSEYCSITEAECKAQGKALVNTDLQDGICCRCVSNEAHCMFGNEEKPIGSTWHNGLCESYECTLSSDGMGAVLKTVIQCMECQPGEEMVHMPDSCCPYCISTENATTTTSNPITTTPFSPGITTGFSTLFTTTSSFTTTGFTDEDDILTGSPTVPPEFDYSTTPLTIGTPIFTSSLPPSTTGVHSNLSEVTTATGTTVPGTTTPSTVASGTTISPPACSEVMQDAAQLPDSRIELTPSTIGSPASIRGTTAEGWMVSEADEPYITIDFTDGASPSILERLDFFGNLRTAKILLKTTLGGYFEPYMGGEPIDVTSGMLSFAEGSDKGIPVYELRLVLLQPIMSDLPFALRLKVYACISDVGVTATTPLLAGTTSLSTPATTIATTIAQPTCSEVMNGDYQLPDSRIIISPTTSGDAGVFRGAGALGWMVTPADAPRITLLLTKPFTDEPTLLERLDVYGNVKTISVSVRTLPTGEFNTYKDRIDVTSGTLSFVDGANSGIMVYAVQISLLETSTSGLPFALRLQVFACVKDLAETTTSLGTTSIGFITTTPNFDDFTRTGTPIPILFESGTTTMQPASTFTTGIGFTTLPGTTPAGSTIGTTASQPQACSDVMTDESKLPDSSIELSPSTRGSPSSLRGPTAEGWSVTEQDEPAITISLTSPRSTQPTLLEKLVFYGNVRTVSVMIQTTETGAFEPYKGGEAIDVTSGTLSFATGTEGGIMVYGVQVLLLEAIMSDLPFTVRLQVYACFPEATETTAAPGTTPSQTTTELVTGGTTVGQTEETTVPGTTTPPAQVKETTVPGTTQPPTTPCISEVLTPTTDKCSYGGKVYELNSVWTDTQSVCLSCTCLTGGVTCRGLQDSCDLTCSGELVKVEGQCCPVCQPRTEFCSVTTVQASPLIDGCTPDEPIQQTTCSGSCTSTIETSLSTSILTSSYRSCQALGSKEVAVSMTCANGEKRSHTYTVITSCACGASCMCAATNPFK